MSIRVQGFSGGFADPFDDDTAVDAGVSSNYSYDAANDRFGPTAAGYSRITEATESAPIGNTTDIANINDNNSATTSTWTGQNLTGQSVANRRIWQLDLGSVVEIGKVEILQFRGNLSSAGPNNGFYTSEDGVTWTQYGSLTLLTTSPADYSQAVTRSARYIAWVVEAVDWAGSGYTWTAGDLNVYVDLPDNMTVVSDALALGVDPATVRVLVEIYAGEAVTVNTDFTLAASRDDGTTFTVATLAPYFGNFYEATIDVSGQPSGGDLRLRFQTFNNKNVGVSGWFAQAM